MKSFKENAPHTKKGRLTLLSSHSLVIVDFMDFYRDIWERERNLEIYHDIIIETMLKHLDNGRFQKLINPYLV